MPASRNESLVQVVKNVDIPRNWTLQKVIDELIEKTDWQQFAAMMVDLNEGEFTVSISVFKKGETR